jgi:hypothetical protein
MGTLHKYVCRSCGYYAEVSGGEDAGMESVTTTIVCEDCRRLYDIQIDAHPFSKSPEEALIAFPICCPRCAIHRVREWKEGRGVPEMWGTDRQRWTNRVLGLGRFNAARVQASAHAFP